MKGVGLELSFGNEVIYEDASFSIDTNSKVGIVGVNGAGKTTLFKIILGMEKLDKGEIVLYNDSLGYLLQEVKIDDEDMTIYEYIMSARPIKTLEGELVTLYESLTKSHPKDEKRLLKKAAKIQDRLDVLGQYDAEDDLLELAEMMNISLDMLEAKVKNLSGGEKSKIAFAHLLFSKSDILLLDEPTNHLDSSTKSFVTEYLKDYHGMELIISHDIEFLNDIVDKIMFIDKVTHKIHIYDGNYSDFKKTYARERAAKSARIDREEREIKKLEEFVRRADAASRTNHNLKRLGASREKELKKRLASLEERDKDYKHVKMKIEPSYPIGKVPLEVEGLTFAYPEGPILYKNLSFTLLKDEKFLIVGENGIGKSTLLKLLMNRLTPLSGTIKFNQKALISYYAQELEILDEEKTVFENVKSSSFREEEIRGYLGNFLFTGDEIYKKTSVLSPGEKARLALCKVLMSKANFIILDEPTNHFDPETQKIIGENFRDYPGTLILVSHNPTFVEALGITRMLVLPDGKILNYSNELLEYYYYLNTELF